MTKNIFAVIRVFETGDARVTVTEDDEALPEQWYYLEDGGLEKAKAATELYVPSEFITIQRVD